MKTVEYKKYKPTSEFKGAGEAAGNVSYKGGKLPRGNGQCGSGSKQTKKHKSTGRGQ
jgi:hypothetical protein